MIPSRKMRRRIAILALAPLLLWTTWGRSPLYRESHSAAIDLAFVPVEMPSRQVLEGFLGPFALEGAWQAISANARVFGYSAIEARPNGTLRAFNDSGGLLIFAPPGAPATEPKAGWLKMAAGERDKAMQDVESVTHDPATGTYWAALEGENSIVRLSPKLAETGRVAPRAMTGWGRNTGAEAMARLPDGRFIAIREVNPSATESRLHEALLFAGDPITHPRARRFWFDAPDNFSVVDMTLLPDGRALILLRRLLWPLPMRFAGRIVIADTAQVRPGETWHSAPLAALASVLPVDNFEAITAVPQADGRIVVWIMSDDNHMRTLQRTLLWKLSVDPARLPWPK